MCVSLPITRLSERLDDATRIRTFHVRLHVLMEPRFAFSEQGHASRLEDGRLCEADLFVETFIPFRSGSLVVAMKTADALLTVRATLSEAISSTDSEPTLVQLPDVLLLLCCASRREESMELFIPGIPTKQ